MVSAADPDSLLAPDGAARRLVDALASVPGVPAAVASAAYRLRAEPRRDGPLADGLGRRLLEGLDRELLAARWVELSGPGPDAAPQPAGEAALAAAAGAVADLVLDLADGDASGEGDREPHALRARRRRRAPDGIPLGWCYDVQAHGGSPRVVHVPDGAPNAPLAVGETVIFDRLTVAPLDPDPDPDDAAPTHVARGAVGLPTAAEVAEAALVASRRLVLVLALVLGRGSPLGAHAAALHAAAAREPDLDPADELARLLREGAPRAEGPATHRTTWTDTAVVAAARRFLGRLAGEPRADALADAALAFPTVPESVLADLWPGGEGGRRDAADGAPLPSGA